MVGGNYYVPPERHEVFVMFEKAFDSYTFEEVPVPVESPLDFTTGCGSKYGNMRKRYSNGGSITVYYSHEPIDDELCRAELKARRNHSAMGEWISGEPFRC
jgi:hypothetical protein